MRKMAEGCGTTSKLAELHGLKMGVIKKTTYIQWDDASSTWPVRVSREGRSCRSKISSWNTRGFLAGKKHRGGAAGLLVLHAPVCALGLAAGAAYATTRQVCGGSCWVVGWIVFGARFLSLKKKQRKKCHLTTRWVPYELYMDLKPL